MRHDGVASGYPTPTGFRRFTGYQRNPRDRGVTESKYYPTQLPTKEQKIINSSYRWWLIRYPPLMVDQPFFGLLLLISAIF